MRKIEDIRYALDLYCKDHICRCAECPAYYHSICARGDHYWKTTSAKEINKDVTELWGDSLDGYYDKQCNNNS